MTATTTWLILSIKLSTWDHTNTAPYYKHTGRISLWHSNSLK